MKRPAGSGLGRGSLAAAWVVAFGLLGSMMLGFLGPPALFAQEVRDQEVPAQEAGPRFRRGDANLDSRVSLADVFAVLRYVAFGGSLWCLDAADADDSGTINSTDALFLLGSLYYGHGFPPEPFLAAGADPTPDTLACARERPPESPAPAGGGAGAAEDEVGGAADPTECDGPHTGGSDLDFIYMHKSFGSVSPGESHVRVPIQLRSIFGGLEGIALSVHVPPEHVRLERIEFERGLLSKLPHPPVWRHDMVGRREEGYLATSLVMSFQAPFHTLPPVPAFEPLASIVLSVDEDAPLGEVIPIRFESTPGTATSMQVDNEISRGGKTQSLNLCGLYLQIVPPGDFFIRGDVNWDRKLNLSDPILVLRYLFAEELATLPCADAADFDDDGRVALTDAIGAIKYLFLRGPAPASPFPAIGVDPSADTLGCEP